MKTLYLLGVVVLLSCSTTPPVAEVTSDAAEREARYKQEEKRKPARTPAEAKKKVVNLNVKGAPLDKVIRTLAAESNKSLVLGNTVAGSVSVTLNNMPYEQAIDMILRPTAYRAEHSGDVTIIRSAKDDKTFRAFKLKYVDVNSLLQPVKDIASKDGQVAIDANSNSVFVVDRFETLKNIEVMLAQLDQEPRQVEVEVALIEVDSNNAVDIGFDIAGIAKAGTNAEIQADIHTNKLNPLDPTLAGTKGVFVGLSWNSVRSIVGALASKTKLNILARPRVLALTDQEASIVLGSRLGYKTVVITTTGTLEDVKFLTVGTQLKIKPHITMNNDILMYLKPEISDGQIDSRTNLPSSNTTTTETKVLAKNGQTIVIGGLIRDRVEKKTDRVPILGDIPILGYLFGGTSHNTVKSEVIVLLSPKLVNNEMIAGYEDEGKKSQEKFLNEAGIGITPSRLMP